MTGLQMTIRFVIEAFVAALDLAELGFGSVEPAGTRS